MREYDHVYEVMADLTLPESVKSDVLNTISDATADGCEYDDSKDCLNHFFGGKVYYVETKEDLKEIKHFTITDGNSFPSVLDCPGAFDGARYIDENMISLFSAINDAGGPVYYIPRSVYNFCPHVEESVKLTEIFWSTPDENSTT